MHSKSASFAMQNGAFCSVKWCVLQSKMVRFAIPMAMNQGSEVHQLKGDIFCSIYEKPCSKCQFSTLCIRKSPLSTCINMQNAAYLCKNSLKKAYFQGIQMLNFRQKFNKHSHLHLRVSRYKSPLKSARCSCLVGPRNREAHRAGRCRRR